MHFHFLTQLLKPGWGFTKLIFLSFYSNIVRKNVSFDRRIVSEKTNVKFFEVRDSRENERIFCVFLLSNILKKLTMGGFQRAGTGKNKKVIENSPLLAF